MGMDCDFVAKAATAEEVMQMASDHGMKTHKEKMDEMAKTMSPDQMKAAMMSAMKDVPM
jgi:predicted small metal-binding protein